MNSSLTLGLILEFEHSARGEHEMASVRRWRRAGLRRSANVLYSGSAAVDQLSSTLLLIFAAALCGCCEVWALCGIGGFGESNRTLFEMSNQLCCYA